MIIRAVDILSQMNIYRKENHFTGLITVLLAVDSQIAVSVLSAPF